MKSSRRRFLLGAGSLLAYPLLGDAPRASPAMSMPEGRMAPQLAEPSKPLVNPATLARFVDALPIPPVARADTHRTHPAYPGRQLPCYRMDMRAFATRLHRDLPPTTLWGYQGSFPGPTLEAMRGEPFLVEWANALPSRHLLPVDHTIHGAEKHQPEVRTITHVHGARVPADSDGWPEDAYPPGRSLLCHYPNAQDAATLWYHDHAMGITRLNIYAGLLGAYLLRDPEERSLGLPAGALELPLILCDRLIARDGQLYYPVSDDPAAPWVSEAYGNATLCNGKLYPYVEVEPRRYRLRLINAANARHFELSLSSRRPFLQIGSDQGLLSAPLERMRVELYPAERADVLVDFAGLDGQSVELRQPGEPILQFRVRNGGRRDAGAPPIPSTLHKVPRIDPANAVRERILAVGEMDDANGNAMMMTLGGHHWSDPITEDPMQDSTEIWSLVNLTGDAHPIHLHLVRFQIIERRPFDLFAWNERKELKYTGPGQPPPPHEAGWKDTVRADPDMVTRIIMRFEGEPGKYVWHCHLLEHEDNEMMRPFKLLPRA